MGRENPLLNNVIVSTLVEICDEDHLPNIRLVCKLWYQLSLERWRRRTVLTVHQCLTKKKKRKIMTQENLVSLYSDPEDKHKLQKQPFRNFRIARWKFTEDWLESTFWDTCSRWLHELHLYSCSFNDITSLESLLFCKTPNLKRLKMNAQNFKSVPPESLPDVDDADLVPIKEQCNLTSLKIWGFKKNCEYFQWRKFLHHFPYLQKLELSLGPDDTMETYNSLEKFLDSVKLIRERNKTKLRVTHLEVMDLRKQSIAEFPESICNLLEQLKLPLEVLTIDIGLNTPECILRRIISCHTSTLKILKIFRGPDSSAFPDFPFGINMDSLEELHLHGPISPNLSFLKFTPNLKKLAIVPADVQYAYKLRRLRRTASTDTHPPSPSNKDIDMVLDTKEFCDMSGFQLPKLCWLQCHILPDNKNSLETLGHWIPNLEVFWGHVTAELFPVLCSQWQTTLKELCLDIPSNVNDFVITGLSNSNGEIKEADISYKETRPPNITCLKHLQIVEIRLQYQSQDDCSHEPTHLTDHTFWNGFLQLPELKRVETFISKEMTEKTARRLEEQHITTNVHINDKCSCGRNDGIE